MCTKRVSNVFETVGHWGHEIPALRELTDTLGGIIADYLFIEKICKNRRTDVLQRNGEVYIQKDSKMVEK